MKHKIVCSLVNINEIEVGSRLKYPDQSRVDHMVESIRMTGLINPISISNGVLVVGLCRLSAFKLLGYSEILCYKLDHIIDPNILKVIEIDDNLFVSSLTKSQIKKCRSKRESILNKIN